MHAIIDAAPFRTSPIRFILENQHPLNQTYGLTKPFERPFLLPLSASDKVALDRFVEKVREIPGNVRDGDLFDVAYTLSRRTSHFNRAFAIARGQYSSFSDVLRKESLSEGETSSSPPSISFVFTGQGAQWPEMGKDLLEDFPLARQDLELMQQCLDSLPDGPTWSLKEELLVPAQTSQIQEASRCQTLCTALQILLVNILRTWGIYATAVVGHSSGEIAAAYAAGVLTASQAITVAYYRGKCISDSITKDKGGMMAVSLTPEDVARHIEGNVTIACYNSPKNLTLSGPRAELAALEAKLKSQGIFARILQVGYGYHSKQMLEAGDSYIAAIAGRIKIQPPGNRVQVFSTVSGTLALDDWGNADYWRRNLEKPVNFAQALEQLLADNAFQYLVEIGPHGALAGPVRQARESLGLSEAKIRYVSAFERHKPAFESLLHCCGSLWLAGHKLDMVAINSVQSDDGKTSIKGRLIVDFPTYAWNRTQHWFEGRVGEEWRFRQHARHDLLGSRLPGGHGMEAQWRNILRCKDIEWLTSHNVSLCIINVILLTL